MLQHRTYRQRIDSHDCLCSITLAMDMCRTLAAWQLVMFCARRRAGIIDPWRTSATTLHKGSAGVLQLSLWHRVSPIILLGMHSWRGERQMRDGRLSNGHACRPRRKLHSSEVTKSPTELAQACAKAVLQPKPTHPMKRSGAAHRASPMLRGLRRFGRVRFALTQPRH